MQALITDQAAARKLMELARAMQPTIDAQARPRLENTPKRARQGAEARNELRHLERTQKALRVLATANEQGACPTILARLGSKKAVYDLMKSKVEYNGGYYDAGRDTGKPYHDTPQALALWALCGNSTQHDQKKQALEEALHKVKFSNIAGYFPTPAPLVARMVARADLQAGQNVLEPSAGSGNIADAIRQAAPECDLRCCEINHSLANILMLKNHQTLPDDFMNCPDVQAYDRILMNPPFENSQDIEHIQKAFRLLRSGGKLIAIMSHGPFFRQDRKAEAFRQWFIDVAGEPEEIPAGAFKESGTNIPTVLVEIRKE